MTVDEFKWEVLAECDEMHEMLYLPLAQARTQLSDLSESERQAIVERVLRKLLQEGLIYLFRAPADRQVIDAAEDPSLRLDKEEARAVISGDSWRTIPPSRDGIDVFIGSTPDGEAACADPPEEIRRFWDSPSQG
jgi:hypothetical protein